MMKIKCIVLYFILISISYHIYPEAGLAYHDRVHKKITSVAMAKAAVFNNRLKDIGFQDGIEQQLTGNLNGIETIREWIIYGRDGKTAY